MKTLHKSLWKRGPEYSLSVLLTALLPNLLFAQSGRVQWVHASADPVLEIVDVYVDGLLAIDDFAYRGATPFTDPMPGSHKVAVAPGTSTSVADSLASFSLEIDGDTDYHVIIAGVLDPDEFKPNPNGRSTSLNIFVADGAVQESPFPAEIMGRSFYGVTDLAAVNLVTSGGGEYANLRYGDFGDYGHGAPGYYVGSLKATGRGTSSLFDAEADFASFAGRSYLGIFCGFFAAPDGLGLESFEVYPDGTTRVRKDLTKVSRTQLVHASADPSVDVVDVYLDGSLLLDDFAFKTATAFLDLPIGNHDIDVAPATSIDLSVSLMASRENLAVDTDYQMIIAGVLDPDEFKPNPNGRSTSLNIFVADGAVQASPFPADVMGRSFYGVTDLAAVNLVTSGGSVFANLRYGDFGDYAHGAPGYYVGSLKATGRGTSSLFDAEADFASFAGRSYLGIFCGFFAAPDGLGLESFEVYPDGTTKARKDLTKFSRAQLVHASADPSVEVVDVYLDGSLLLDDFAFKTATAFLDLPLGNHDIDVAPATSIDLSVSLMASRENLAADTDYQMIIAGVLNPDEFGPNPDERDTKLQLFSIDDALENSGDPAEFAVRQFYGVIDLPEINFWYNDEYVLFENMGYGDFTEIERGGTIGPVTGSVRPVGANTGDLGFFKTTKDWGPYRGQAILEILTGFYYSQPGELPQGIRWFYVLGDGEVAEHETQGLGVGMEDEAELPVSFSLRDNYPNPFNPTTTISYTLPRLSEATLTVYDMLGRKVSVLASGTQPAGSYEVSFDATGLPSGVYFYRLQAGDYVIAKQMVVVR